MVTQFHKIMMKYVTWDFLSGLILTPYLVWVQGNFFKYYCIFHTMYATAYVPQPPTAKLYHFVGKATLNITVATQR